MPSPQPSHPLAEPFAAALFGEELPDAIEFVMLLTEVSQLPPAEYAVMWSQVVEIGRGSPTVPRERALYALNAPSRVLEAQRLVTILGEVSPEIQRLAIRTLRLTLRRQMSGEPIRRGASQSV